MASGTLVLRFSGLIFLVLVFLGVEISFPCFSRVFKASSWAAWDALVRRGFFGGISAVSVDSPLRVLFFNELLALGFLVFGGTVSTSFVAARDGAFRLDLATSLMMAESSTVSRASVAKKCRVSPAAEWRCDANDSDKAFFP